MNFKRLKEFSDKNNIGLTDEQIHGLEEFAEILIEKNKVMNLTAITDPDEVEIKHMVDSLEGVNLIKELGPVDFKLLDVGCGAGFPGIPLSIAFPQNDITLLDSLNKRINFVNDTLDQLGLSAAHGIAARAEDFKEREKFDFCTSRAVARMNVLLEYSLPFVKIGGHCLLYKSGEYKEELKEASKALAELGGEFVKAECVELPYGGGSRTIVVIKKVSSTPDKYPRRAGKPTKSPIK